MVKGEETAGEINEPRIPRRQTRSFILYLKQAIYVCVGIVVSTTRDQRIIGP